MAKVGRNALCPCGSGKKYKRCCGDPLKEQPTLGGRATKRMSRFVDIMRKRREARELDRTRQQGLGRQIISDTIGDRRIVAVGDTIHYSDKWKFFADFLTDYIKIGTGPEWGNAEIAKPFGERHPILQWYDAYCRFQKRHKKQPDGDYVGRATGAVLCYLGVAYNLYLLKHNVELQQRFIARLKDIRQFQGAYYELVVANCLIIAGFDLALEDEADARAKHCEFSAVSKQTGRKYWVEAKMRAVSGLLGKTAVDGGPMTAKPTSKLTEHLRDALRKPAEDERLIFIDVNAAPEENLDPASDQPEMPKWMQAAAQQLDDRERNANEDHRAYIFVTNVPFHRMLDEEVQTPTALTYGLGIPDFSKPGHYRLPEIWKRKQKHIDAHNILDALQSYPKIPTTFDGSLPMTNQEVENRIEIGQTYFFENTDGKGTLGEVTEATISESEKTLYVVVRDEDGKSHIRSRKITDEELSSYKDAPDTYFGVVRPAVKHIDSPYEFFESLVNTYKETPKEKLLEFCKHHPNAKSLSKLDREELMLVICEGWAINAAVSREGKDSGGMKVDPDS